MIYLRYKNGNGKYYGHHTEIDAESTLDRNSYLFDNADVYSSTLTRTSVRGASTIRLSTIDNSLIGHPDHPTEIAGSFLGDCYIEGGTILGSWVFHSRTLGTPVIRTGALVRHCTVRDGAYIEGRGTQVSNLVVGSRMRIGYGQWDGTPPRYIEIQSADGEIIAGVTESTDGYAYIGCQRKKMTSWLKKRDAFSKIAGWDKQISDKVCNTFQEWLDVKHIQLPNRTRPYPQGAGAEEITSTNQSSGLYASPE